MIRLSTFTAVGPRRRFAGRRSGAFTLIELLAATLIAAVLMAGVLNVVSHLGRDQRRLAVDGDADPERVIGLIRLDLARAVALTPLDRTAEPGAACLTLDGYGELSPVTLGPTGRPARVVYRVADLSGERWLVRQEWGRDGGGSDRDGWTEPVTGPVARFVVTLAGPDAPPISTERPHPVPLPTCIHIQIEWSDGRPPVDRDLVLR